MSSSHVAPSSEISIAQTIARPVAAIAHSIRQFFISLRKASDAARHFEQLSAMSDAELDRRGLNRETIARHIVDKHLTF